MTATPCIGIVLTGRYACGAPPRQPYPLHGSGSVFPLRIDRLSRMFSVALLAVAAYAATNIDNLFVLLAFLAETGGQRRRVIAGQFAGSLILIAGSILLAALLTRLPPGYVGLLGLLPIGVGLSKAWARFRSGNADQVQEAQVAARTRSPATPATAGAGSSWWTVACVAVANGSDNLAVYVPLYASHSHSEGMFISLVFIVMIGLWCAGAVWLVEHPLLGAPIRRYGTALLPLILLVIGVSVIVQNDTLRIVFGI
ncbi:Cadmium resistance protein CadD, predicted permease [Burkholderia sp. OK233]|nr:Cadmium resistance protein CadD, predicted permease [Burkholderia sp. OK233]